MAQEPPALRNLMVNYIPTTVDEMQLRQLFEMYGPIESVKIVVDRETRQSRGYGFVEFRFGFSAVNAIQYLNGYPVLSKRLKVSYANAIEAEKALADPNNPYAGGYSDPRAYFAAQHMAMMQYYQQLQMGMQGMGMGGMPGMSGMGGGPGMRGGHKH